MTASHAWNTDPGRLAPPGSTDTHRQSLRSRLLAGDLAVPFYFGLLMAAVHLLLNFWGGYGIFRDELYYIACSEHPAAGYVDQPPFSILVLALVRLLFGESLFAIRLVPALASGTTVFVTGLIARELGGGRRAQFAACLGWSASLANLGMFSIYSMNALDHLLWAVAILVFVSILREPSPRLWLLLGAVVGIGLLNKISVLWLGAGIVAGLVASPRRRELSTVWPWAGAGLAFLLFLPYIVWNVTHDMAHLEFIRNAMEGKYSGLTRVSFLTDQFIIQNPFTLPLWLGGLIVLLAGGRTGPRLPLGVAFLTACAVLLVNGHSKGEYLAAAYPPLWAGGGLLVERFFTQGKRSIIGVSYLALTAAATIAFSPFALPVIPVESFIRYAEVFGVSPSTPERHRLDRLPQFYADMFGWEKKAVDVAAVYHALPSAERGKCAIFGDNYGRAAAIDFFGPRYGLPKSIGRHNNYWIWGPRGYTGEVVIVLGGDLEDKKQVFDSVEVAGVSTCEYCIPYENNLRIYVCRNLQVPLAEMWQQLKAYE